MLIFILFPMILGPIASAQDNDALTMCRTGQEAVRKFCIEDMDQVTFPNDLGQQGYAEAQKGLSQLRGSRLQFAGSEAYCNEAYRNAIEKCQKAENQADRQMDDQARKDVREAVKDIEKQFKEGRDRLENSLKAVDQRIKDLESIMERSRAAPPKTGEAGS